MSVEGIWKGKCIKVNQINCREPDQETVCQNHLTSLYKREAEETSGELQRYCRKIQLGRNCEAHKELGRQETTGMGGRVQAWTTAAHQGWTQRTIPMLFLTVLHKAQEFSDFLHWESPVVLGDREGRCWHTELLCLWSWVVVGAQLNISGEDADLHVSDEYIPGTLRNVPSSPPPTSKNEQMMHREAFSVSGVDQVGLSHMISSACGRAAPGSPGAKRCPPALHNAACHCCSHCLGSLTTVWRSEEHAAKHNSQWEGKTHAVRILKVWLMKYSSQHLPGGWQLLHYECCHSCKKSTALSKGLIFSSSFKPLA